MTINELLEELKEISPYTAEQLKEVKTKEEFFERLEQISPYTAEQLRNR